MCVCVGVYRGEGRYSFLGFRHVSSSSQPVDFLLWPQLPRLAGAAAAAFQQEPWMSPGLGFRVQGLGFRV